MQPSSFIFQATEVFGIFGQGFVFRGNVMQGQVHTGEAVQVAGKNRIHHARVAAIELDGRLMEHSILGHELGLLLNEFDAPQVSRILASRLDSEAASDLPLPETLLSIDLPVEISAINAA